MKLYASEIIEHLKEGTERTLYNIYKNILEKSTMVIMISNCKVCDKCLRDRKNGISCNNYLLHYFKIIKSAKRTKEIEANVTFN